MGSTALRFRPLTFCDLCAKYSCIQVMFPSHNSSLQIHCMLNFTSADSYTPVPYSQTWANAWMIHFPHVSFQNEFCPSSWCSCSLCLIRTDPKPAPCWQRTDLQVKSCSSLARSQSSNFLQTKLLCQMLRTMKSGLHFRYTDLLCSDQILALMLKDAMDWTDKLLCEWKNTEPIIRTCSAPNLFNAKDSLIHLWLFK